MTRITGTTTKDQDTNIGDKAHAITAQYTSAERKALEVLNVGWLKELGTDAAEANSTVSKIVATSHAVTVGMLIEFTSGALDGQQFPVLKVDTNNIYLAEEASVAPSAGDTFKIYRYKNPSIDDFTSITASVTLPDKDVIEFVRNDYTSVNVTTGAYVQLIASTSAESKKLQIFDSSGETLYLALGGAGSEVDKLIIVPGGNGEIEVVIPASSRISIKAISATASTGEIVINLLG